ncbi:ribonuclease P protein component [Oceanispirochaeta crateris]|uniref:Ribonuclease P protein component n=1 Tax=Oceanispirochaeta crateris TaxID=2518645 RepID=A0A5C1QP06_9SPIO|nr:ribonuclease P protein component [Oceanispirochaeta crateris]QEN09078.1 ribonuclease P protein component [Oceanispirochaeta crateris]
MKENLTKNERLGKKSDLNRIFANGNTSKCYGAKILFLKSSLTYSRFAITIVRKFGNAVERNYTKRIFREFFRKQKFSIKESYDIVFVVYPGDFSYQNRLEQFNLLIKRANLVKSH